jgi:hypothetical protein
MRVSKVTEKIKTRSKPTQSENFNSHPLYENIVITIGNQSNEAF